MAANNQQPIIIIKKKVNGHGHHGGAWKVAYADFVTAMMALFIVLWLMSSSEKVKKAVGGYFKDPQGLGKESGTTHTGNGESVDIKKDDMNKLRERLQEAMKKMQDFSRIHQQVEMTITAEGLRIELIETKGGFFFENGSADLTSAGKEVLAALAKEIATIPNHVLIEGHTNSVQYGSNAAYSNWELSTDRANSARRVMEAAGVRADQTSYVRGLADRRLRIPNNPLDPANRRVSLVIQYQDAEPEEVATTPVGVKDAVAKSGDKTDHHSGEKPSSEKPSAPTTTTEEKKAGHDGKSAEAPAKGSTEKGSQRASSTGSENHPAPDPSVKRSPVKTAEVAKASH